MLLSVNYAYLDTIWGEVSTQIWKILMLVIYNKTEALYDFFSTNPNISTIEDGVCQFEEFH